MNEQPQISLGQRIALSVPLVLILVSLVTPPNYSLLKLFTGWGSDLHGGVHKFHDIATGAGALMLAAGAAFVLARPERSASALRQIVVVAAAFPLAAVVAQEVWPPVFIYPVLAAVAIALHPRRGDIIRLDRMPSLPMLAFVAIAAVPLIWFALDEASLQRSAPATDVHADEYHWVSMTVRGFALILTGLVASLRGPGWRVSAWSAGAAAVIFGVASVAYPNQASSLGTGWGIAAIAGGIAFVALAEMTAMRGSRAPEPDTAPA